MPQPSSPIAVIDDERFDAHSERHGSHPERPERLVAARGGLYSVLPERAIHRVAVRPATDSELIAVHAERYVRTLERELVHGHGRLDPDTFFSPGTQQAAWLAAGGAAELARTLMTSPHARGIALLRPPGHHAEANHAMGFCLLNNIAVAAHAALAAGARRVAIVDWDVHHGNGTQAAFYDDPRVLFVSLHQYPFYPGTGAPGEIGSGAGRGYTANIALPAEQGAETYGHAWRRVVLPLLEQFGADIVLVSAGFDAHHRDPLAQMRLDSACYQSLASALIDSVDSAGHGRIGFILEGGYDLQALDESVAGVARALTGERLALPEGAPSAAGRGALADTRRALSPFWKLDDSA